MDTDGQEMHGRSTELAGLRKFLDLLPASGGALVLRGEPGIGRSSLLRWTAAQAEVRGVRVVALAAVQDEFHLPYAGLRRLADRLPAPVAKAVSEGLPLAKVALALLEAISALADERPVLVVVDDGHWLDQASWTALAFVARRLTHDPALVLLAMRDGAATSARLPGSGLAELPIEPLADEAARELLARRVPNLRPDVAVQVLALAGGNPLGLVDLGAVADQPLAIRLERAFAQVAEHLPAPARTLVQVAALADGPDGDEIVAAARLLDPAVSEEDLGPAVAERVLEVGAGFRIGFRHPLMRSAVRQAAGVERRRQVHQALSAVLAGHPDRQLGHRASAAAAPDVRLAADLADAAAQAYRRGDLGSAVPAYERAAQLSEDPVARADFLLSGAYHAYEAGDPTTVKRLLAGLAESALPVAARARYAQIVEWIDDDPYLADLPAHSLFYADADRATWDRVVDMVRRLPGADDDPRKLCVLGLIAPLEQYVAVLPAVRQQAIALTAGPAELHLLAQAAFGIGALPAALRLSSAAVAGLRAQRIAGPLAPALNLHAALATQLGNVTLAETSAAEARLVAVETAQSRWVATADLTAARAAAMRGDTPTAQALADAAERAPHLVGGHPVRAAVYLVRGQAAAAAGLFDTAFDDLRALFDLDASPYHANLRFWALPFLAEAAMLCGRADQLGEIVAGLAPLRATGLPILQVGFAYADAVLADAEEEYRRALARDDLGDWPFELARLQQAYGTWLRRQRRPVEARPLLRSAANTFSVLGARPWAARADAELRASGERMPPGPEARRALTPQELQIANLAADGLSNREIATRLVLSPRTIDSHLYRAFRKLGVTSRTQLTKLLRSAPDRGVAP